MSPVLSIGIYVLMVALAFWCTDYCLRGWAWYAGAAARAYWLVPGILLSLLPVMGALLPDSGFKFALQGAGNVWLGFFLYYGFILVVLLALTLPARHAQWRGGVALGVSLVMALAVWGYGLHHAQDTRVVRYDLEVDKTAGEIEEMKLILLGDLHLSVNSRLATTQRMVELINAEQPDAVVIAGDIFTSSYGGLSHPEQYAEALRGIQTKYGVYAAYGNHDVEETLFGGFPISPISEAFSTREMEQFFDDSGFITLADEAVTLGDGVVLAGRIDGEKAGDGTTNRMTPGELLDGVDTSLPVLVLEHEPKEFEALREAGADIALCGHTHAGQMFPGNLIVPFFNENAWGYKRLHELDTYVTAGVGYYGPPLRVGTDSEITVINLKFGGEKAE